MSETSNLAQTVKRMRPTVPAMDFDLSKRFYVELGFRPEKLTEDLVEMQCGEFSFILQGHCVQQWADNLVMHLELAAWGSLFDFRRSPASRSQDD
jgi:hypothetical protein